MSCSLAGAIAAPPLDASVSAEVATVQNTGDYEATLLAKQIEAAIRNESCSATLKVDAASGEDSPYKCDGGRLSVSEGSTDSSSESDEDIISFLKEEAHVPDKTERLNSNAVADESHNSLVVVPLSSVA
ncbi:MAG: hypothetical protein ACI4NP_04955, partial [Thermoguttaceae bacterium]